MTGKPFTVACFAILITSSIVSLPAFVSDTTDICSSCVADDFTVKCGFVDVFAGTPPGSREADLCVYSNGTATYHIDPLDFLGDYPTNWTTQMTHEQVTDLYDVLVSEGFMSFNDSYDDPGWTYTWFDHVETVSFERSGVLKTVDFNGRSMIGVAPGLYAMLSNLACVVVEGRANIPDSVLEIVVSEPQGGGVLANITANFTNNSDFTLTDFGLCNTSWPIFIVSTNGTTVVDAQNYVNPTCVMEFAPGTTTEFGPWKWNRTGLQPGSYVVMSRVSVWNYVVGNISADSTWIPNDYDPNPDNDSRTEIVYIGLAGIGVAAVAGVVVFYAFRLRKAGP